MSAVVQLRECMWEFGGFELLGYATMGPYNIGTDCWNMSWFASMQGYNPALPSAETLDHTFSSNDGSYTGTDFSGCPTNTVAWQIIPNQTESYYSTRTISFNPSTSDLVYEVDIYDAKYSDHVPRELTVTLSWLHGANQVFQHTSTKPSFQNFPYTPTTYGPFLQNSNPSNPNYTGPIGQLVVFAQFDRTLNSYFDGS